MPTPHRFQQSTAELTPEAIPVTFSISEVAEQTGISENVLRVWEARYGWPRPGRRSNGYRCYPITLIALLQAVRVEIDRGSSIGDLLRDPVWGAMMEAGRLPARDASTARRPPDWSTIPQPYRPEARLLREKLERALVRGDSGTVAWVEAQAAQLHPSERERAVTAVLALWRNRSTT